MNKLLVIIFAAVAAFAVLCIAAYIIKWPPAVEAAQPITDTWESLTAGNLDTQSVLTTASLAGTATTLVGAYNQYKGKISAQVSSAKEALEKSEALAQVNDIKTELLDTKKSLQAQLEEANKMKDSALQEAENAKRQIKTLEQEKLNLESSLGNNNKILSKFVEEPKIIKIVS